MSCVEAIRVREMEIMNMPKCGPRQVTVEYPATSSILSSWLRGTRKELKSRWRSILSSWLRGTWKELKSRWPSILSSWLRGTRKELRSRWRSI